MTRLLAVLVLGAALATPSLADSSAFVTGSMAAIRAAHSGKPHVIALWSIDCPPCHEELAMLGAWQRENPTARVVLISTDTGSAAAADAALRKHGLGSVENWVFADNFVERLRHEIDPTWHGELPRSYLHDGITALVVSGRLERARLDAWWRATAQD
jgi:thiol-disulfide isomerase/thioredoxin